MKKLLFITLLVVLSFGTNAQNTKYFTSDDKDFRKGLELLDREKYTSASHFFEKYLEGNPSRLLAVESSYYIAFCGMNLENNQAEKYLGKFIDDYPTHPKTVTARYDAGIFYFKKGDYKEAIFNLQKVEIEQISPDERAELMFSLGYSYFIEKNYDKALLKFEKVQHLESPYQFASAYYAGYIFFKNGFYDKAIKAFEKASENETYQPVVPFMIVNIYYHQNKYDKVIEYGTKVISSKKKVSNKNAIILLVGTSYFTKDDYSNTVKYLKPYVKGRKSSVGAKYRVAYSSFQEGDFEFASTQFKLLANDKDSLGQTSAYYLGCCYLKAGNRQFAKNSFRAASVSDFSREVQANSLFNLAKLQYEDEQFAEAITNLERLNNEFSEFKFKQPKNEILTEAYLNSNNLDDAISYIKGIKNPNSRINEIYKEVSYLKGVNLFNRRDYQGAILLFTTSLAKKGDMKFTEAAYFWRAESYSTLYNWEKAQNDYSSVFRTGSSKSKYYRKARYGIGYAYFNSDDEGTIKYDKALDHFEFYVTTVKNPKKDRYDDDALLRLADCLYKKKRYEEAIISYQKAINNGSKSSSYAYFQMGVIYGVVERYNNSTENYDVVIAKFSNSIYVEDAMYNKAKNFYSIGQYQRAIPYYDIYLDKYESTERIPIVHLERAVCYLNIQRYDRALEDFDEVLYNFCTDTVYSSQALMGTQESLTLLTRSAEYDKRLEQYFKCGGKGKERLTFEAARNNYRNEENELAIKGFEKFLREYPESVFVYEVNYYLGMAYFDYGDKIKTKEYLYKIKNSEQKFHFEEALIVLSGVYLEEEAWEKADEINLLLLQITKSEQKRQLILLELMVGTYHLERFDESLLYSKQILSSESRLIYAVNKASLYKGLILFNKKDYEKSTDEFVLLSNNSKDVYGAQAHYMVAKIQYDEGEYLEAIETLKSLLGTRKEFLLWYGEGYILASECYIHLGEEFQGKAYLKDVIDNFPLESVVDHAKEILEELDTKVEAEVEERESDDIEGENNVKIEDKTEE
jgi:tetratricopeptide (TPR) repeat protein